MNDSNLHQALADLVGPAQVLADPARLSEYGLDGLTPGCLVSPGNMDEAAEVIRLANRERKSVLPRGAGTKWSLGGRSCVAHIVLSLERLNRVVDYDAPNLSLTVQAGARLGDIADVLAARGNWLPLDAPFADATIGGTVATNTSGPRRLIYGTARDLVLGMRVVLPTGPAARFGGKVVKNVAGYDMTRLQIGAFGTLGLITELTFRLLPVPEAARTLLAAFPTLEQAGNAVRGILASQLMPAAVELTNQAAWTRILRASQVAAAPRGYHLAIAAEGFAEAVARQTRDLSALCAQQGASEVEPVAGEDQSRFWSALRDFSRIMRAEDPDTIGLKLAVPPASTPDIFRLAEKHSAAGEMDCALTAHAGNGIVYSFFACGTPGELSSAARELQDAVGSTGSALVEWAPWEAKSHLMVWGEPRPEWALMRQIKKELDPAGVMNPGRFVGGI